MTKPTYDRWVKELRSNNVIIHGEHTRSGKQRGAYRKSVIESETSQKKNTSGKCILLLTDISDLNDVLRTLQ